MFAKKTIKWNRAIVFNNEKSLGRLIDEWNRTIVPMRDELHMYRDENAYSLEKSIIDDKACELNAYMLRIQKNKNEAADIVRKYKRMPAWKRIFVA